jgi:hypothetical protein
VAVAFQYVNTSVDGTLGAALTTGSATCFLASTPTGYPNSATAPWRLVLDIGTVSEEIVTVTAGSGTSGSPWSITRGQDGTSAVAHSLGATAGHRITAGDENLSRVHEALSGSGSGAHGLPNSAWVTAAIAALDETTFASALPSVTWSSIPATYKHLLVIVQGKFSETTQQSDSVLCTLNGDSSAVYSYCAQFATNVSGASTAALFGGQTTTSATTSWPLLRMGASQAGATANAGGGWAIIPNYTSATFNKGFYSVSGAGYGSTAFVDQRIVSGWYNPTSQAAITSMTLTAPGSGNFVVGSFVALYGIS